MSRKEDYEFLNEGRLLMIEMKELLLTYAMRLDADKSKLPNSELSRIEKEQSDLDILYDKLNRYKFNYGRFVYDNYNM